MTVTPESIAEDIDPPDPATNANDPSSPAGQGWRQQERGAMAGKWYTPRKGASGVVWRRGNETIAEAQARDERDRSKVKDKRPGSGKKKPPAAPKAPAPTAVDLKELEFLVSEALKAPSMICATIGDPWPAEHMVQTAPVLARNLTHAAQHNPWLRRKLETMVTGEDVMIKLITTGAVFGAAFMYAAPVLIYYLDPGFVPPQAKEMLQIPNRREERARIAAEMERANAQAAEAALRAEAAARNGTPAPTGT